MKTTTKKTDAPKIDASKFETFKTLCKKLGQSVRSTATANALLCFRAFEAYVAAHPETAHGKAKGGGEKSFRTAAAEEADVSPTTIDALLQVGKAIDPLPKSVQHALVSSSLGNSMRVLRKLATKEFARSRASLITTFAKDEKVDAKRAMKALKKKLGLNTSSRATNNGEAKVVHQPAIESGQSFEVEVDGQVFRVRGEIVDGQLRLTPVSDEEDTNTTPPLSAMAVKAAKKTGKRAA